MIQVTSRPREDEGDYGESDGNVLHRMISLPMIHGLQFCRFDVFART